ncbi:MAG: hypothetical protein ACU0AZ_17430 [Paracoccaceae bacterium]
MSFITNDLAVPVRSLDGSWTLPVAQDAFNGHCAIVNLPQSEIANMQVGALVKVSGDVATIPCDVHWRLVAVIGGSAVIIPEDIPSSVPAHSVYRVENAVKGYSSPDIDRQRAE